MNTKTDSHFTMNPKEKSQAGAIKSALIPAFSPRRRRIIGRLLETPQDGMKFRGSIRESFGEILRGPPPSAVGKKFL
jgi:hypothetical protein